MITGFVIGAILGYAAYRFNEGRKDLARILDEERRLSKARDVTGRTTDR